MYDREYAAHSFFSERERSVSIKLNVYGPSSPNRTLLVFFSSLPRRRRLFVRFYREVSNPKWVHQLRI